MRVLPGTLYNLARNRLKRLDTELRDRLTAFAIRDLQQEIERLSHELEMARQMGAHPMSERVGEIETHLAKARALMSEND
jgi:ribosomal protein S2